MDSTSAKTLTESFTHLLQESSKVGTPSGNPIGVAIVSVLLVSLLVVLAAIVIDKRANKYREQVDADRKAEREDEKREAAERLAKAELRAEQQRERDERLQREQRERDENAARERARADQADREQARNKLMEHVDFVVDKLNASYTTIFNRIDTTLGALQGTTQNHDGRIVSLEKELERLRDEVKELSKRK